MQASDTDVITAEFQRQETPEVDATTARVVPAQRSIHWIALQIPPNGLPIGLFHQHVVARTSTGTTRLVVRGEVLRAIVATPASVLVEKSRTTVVPHRIRLRAAAEQPIVIQSAESSARGVTCQIDAEQNQVVVRVEPEAELDSESFVEIHAEAGKASETLRIPLVVF